MIGAFSSETMRPSVAMGGLGLLVAWLGEVGHNVLSLPGLPLLGPESLGPAVLDVALLAAFWRWPGNSPVRVLLVGWVLVNLFVGGILTVLPLGVFPFAPEQTVQHYLAHALYTAAQLPVLWLLLSGRDATPRA